MRERTDGIGAGLLELKPDDSGKPADSMGWEELKDAIDEHKAWIEEQISTTPELIRREKRLAELEVAQQRLATRAATAGTKRAPRGERRKTKGKKVMPTQPRTLAEGRSLDLTALAPSQIKQELDLVVAYLAAGPPKAEREILEAELPTLEDAAGVIRAEKETARRGERLAEALSPTTGTEATQLVTMLGRIQNAERDRSQEEMYLIHFDGRVFPLTTAELITIHEKVTTGLVRGASAVNNFISDIEGAWGERHAKNKDQWVVHGLVKFATGAEDIPRRDIREMVKVGNFYVGRVRDRARGNRLVDAGNDLLFFDGYARYWANKVGQWEGELVSGAGRWVIALTVVKEALSIMAGFGAAKLATAAGGGFLTSLRTGAKIATMTTGTGLLAGGGGSALAGRDVVKGARAGGGAGFGVGTNALTAGVGKVASIADAKKASTFAGKAYAVGKAAALETGVNVGTNVTQALIEGGDTRAAALGGLVSTPVNLAGGAAVDRFAKSKAAATVGKTLVGGTAGMAGAEATGGELLPGALVGAGGGLYGGLASPAPSVDSGGAAGQQPADALPTAADSVLPGAALPLELPAAGGAAPSGGAPSIAGGASTPLELPVSPPQAGPAATGDVAGAGPAPPVAAGPGGGAAALPTGEDLDTAFTNLERGTGPDREPTNMYSAHADALTDARFSRTGGSELDLRNISDISVRDGPASPQPGGPAGPARSAAAPPETWLLEPGRAAITDPAEAAAADFKPKRTAADDAFESRNAQIVAGPQGEAIRTPTGPTFGADRVVGGARGATLDPSTGSWSAADAPDVRAPNPLGQDASFVPRTPEEWHAWEQTHGPLTDEQRYALWFYSDDLSGQINPALRGQRARQFVTDPLARESAARDLDRTMQPVPFDTVVHRKASIADFHDLGVTDPAELVKLTGSTYAHQGYTSTAVAPGKWSGDLDIVIQVPKGTRGRYLAGAPGAEPTNPVKPAPGAPLASMPGEMEFLLERGTSFSIQSAKQDPSTGRWTIEVRVAEQGLKGQPLSNPVPLPGRPSKP